MVAPRWVVCFAALLLGSAAFTAAQAPAGGGVKLDFPDVEGFTRSGPKPFPDPKDGYVVSYDAKQFLVVNVYVYHAGLDRIPDGASSDVVKDEVGRIEEALKELKRRGAYKSYKERASGESRIGDGPKAPLAQRRLFEIDRADLGSILTDVYITGCKNHFVKIRFSYPADKQADSEKAVAPVLTALGKALESSLAQ